MWMKEVFGTDKPVIGMLHLMALPTDPKWDEKGGMQAVIDRARKDVHALQDGGIDGILFCNEYSIPYTTEVRMVTVAAMARIIGELKKDLKVPYGVDLVASPMMVFDLAKAVGAAFIRETLSGAYAGDGGLSDIDMGEVERHRISVGCSNVYTLATLVPEGEGQLYDAPIEDVAKSLTFSIAPGALLVYGPAAGQSVDDSLLARAKKATDTPIFASNGVRDTTVESTLSIADGCVVGTWLKYDGKFYNMVDQSRVERLMEKARNFRGGI